MDQIPLCEPNSCLSSQGIPPEGSMSEGGTWESLTGPFPKPDESSPYYRTVLWMLSSRLCFCLPRGLSHVCVLHTPSIFLNCQVLLQNVFANYILSHEYKLSAQKQAKFWWEYYFVMEETVWET